MAVVVKLIIIGFVVLVITMVIVWIANPNGPPVSGSCRLIKRRLRKDYCSGLCAAGLTCVVTATRPWGWVLGKQAAACACGAIVGIRPPGSVPGVPPPSGNPGVAPITEKTHP
jgi:hypothetical protein